MLKLIISSLTAILFNFAIFEATSSACLFFIGQPKLPKALIK